MLGTSVLSPRLPAVKKSEDLPAEILVWHINLAQLAPILGIPLHPGPHTDYNSSNCSAHSLHVILKGLDPVTRLV
jgi:hypothetical protein